MESLKEPIVFDDLALVEVPVSIGGQPYVLREASGDAAVRYRNTRSNCSKFVDGKFAGVQGPIADAEPRLVSDCLYRVVTLANGETTYSRTEEKLVRSWSDRVQKTLLARLKKISPTLDETSEETVEDMEKQIAVLQEKLAAVKDAGEKVKNSPSGMADGSG